MYKHIFAFGIALGTMFLVALPQALAQRQSAIDEVELESGITLKDWLALPTAQDPQPPLAIGAQAARYIRLYGPYRELLNLVSRTASVEPLSASAITPENATSKLTELRTARNALGDWPPLLMSSAVAHSLAGNRSAALADLRDWLRMVPASERGRSAVVATIVAAGSDPGAVDEYVRNQRTELAYAHHEIPRPTLPIALDPKVWNALEQSEMYRKYRKAKALTINSTRTVIYDGFENMPSDTIKESITVAPVNDACMRVQIDDSQIVTMTVIESAEKIRRVPTWKETKVTDYLCAGIPLVRLTSYTISGPTNSESMSVVRLKNLQGSLYPLAIGNTESVDYELSIGKNFITHKNHKCTIVGHDDASRLNSRLTGSAWKLDCVTSTNVIIPKAESMGSRTYQDILLEDLGITLSMINTLYSEDNNVVLPFAGYRNIRTIRDESGQKTVTTDFKEFTWQIN